MRLTILQLAVVYGSGNPRNVGRLMRAIDQGRFIWIGTGSNKKSLIHHEDVGRAVVAVVMSPERGIHTYNVAAPPCAMREVVECLAAALGRPLPRIRIPASLALGVARGAELVTGGRGRIGQLHATVQKWLADDVYDAGTFRQTFGFEPVVSLREGLQQEVDGYRQRPI